MAHDNDFQSLAGGCLCGDIRYQTNERPIDAGYCHCRLCQRSSGAPVLAWVSINVAGVEFTKAEPESYRSSEHGMRLFCRRCGTQIAFKQVDKPSSIDVNIGSLDDPSKVTPEYHIWTQSRIPWFDVADDLPRYDDGGPDVT